MHAAKGTLRIVLLGGASVHGPVPIARLERKTAGMLALLAVQNTVARSRLAGLLWPDSKETTARNNLAQAVRRLKTNAGLSLVDAESALTLPSEASCDVTDLLRFGETNQLTEAAQLTGRLLEGYDFEDCADFEIWLRDARVRTTSTWTRATQFEQERAVSERRAADALAWAEKLVAVEPFAEAPYVRLARTYLTFGDGPAAMQVYERCRKMLAKELATKPGPAMQDVLKAIRGASADATVQSIPAQSLPAAVLRPRRVGRVAEWELLGRARIEHRTVIVEGEAGSGKSRLVRDFAAAHGDVVLVEGRPGDNDVPFSTLARALRACLSIPERPAMAGWARAEIARVVPELFEQELAEVGATSMRSKVRFFEAVCVVLSPDRDAAVATLLLDDLQWFDSASAEVLMFVADKAARQELRLHALGAHRAGELPREIAGYLERARSGDSLTTVRLVPLGPEEMVELVRSLGVASVSNRAEAIARASRGVPLFALEMVRSIVESHSTDDTVGTELPNKVQSLLTARIGRLSDAGLKLARVAALAGPEFGLELAGVVLGKDPFDLSDAFSELEQAQILEGSRLSHDLLAEVVSASIPVAVRELIHARTAAYLETHGADPARVAQHWQAGGQPKKAAALLVQAGHAARGMSRIGDALSLYDRAARLYEAAGDLHNASEALYLRARSHMGDEADEVVARLERYARGDKEMARALCTRANVALEHGRLDEVRDAGKRGYELAKSAGEKLVAAESVQAWLEADLRSGRLEEAEVAFRLFEQASLLISDDPEAELALDYYRADLLMLAERHREGVAKLEQLLSRLRAWGQLIHSRVGILARMARSLLALGELARARAALEEATRDLASSTTGAFQAEAEMRVSRGMMCLLDRDLEGVVRAVEGVSFPTYEIRMELAARTLGAMARLELGEDAADAELASIGSDARADARTRADAALARCRLALSRGQALPDGANELVERYGGKEHRARLSLVLALATPKQPESYLKQARELAAELDLPPLNTQVAEVEAKLRDSGR